MEMRALAWYSSFWMYHTHLDLLPLLPPPSPPPPPVSFPYILIELDAPAHRLFIIRSLNTPDDFILLPLCVLLLCGVSFPRCLHLTLFNNYYQHHFPWASDCPRWNLLPLLCNSAVRICPSVLHLWHTLHIYLSCTFTALYIYFFQIYFSLPN